MIWVPMVPRCLVVGHLRLKRHQDPRSHVVQGDIDQSFNLGIHPLDILGHEIVQFGGVFNTGRSTAYDSDLEDIAFLWFAKSGSRGDLEYLPVGVLGGNT